MIPIPPWVAADPIATYFRELFATLDWSLLPERDPETPGPRPVPATVYLKTLLVKIDKRLGSMPALRHYLLDHPALQWELGFRPRGDQPMVPSSRWLGVQQHRLGPVVARMLAHTVRLLDTAIPHLDAMPALDATHHLAWVKQNNPNQTLAHRFDAQQQPAGDPECRLGAKTQHPYPGGAVKLAFWGYHSAIVATETAAGPVVLGATVQPVVAQEVTLVHPLIRQLEANLGHPPAGLTADAAFDAWWVWDWVVKAGGTAAIAHNPRRGTVPRSSEGHPICDHGEVMRPTWRGTWRGHAAQGYGCPQRGPAGGCCPDPRFATGGCKKTINREAGGLARVLVDRQDPVYQAAFAKRTAVERVFSRIKAWGLDRPRARRQASVTTIILTGYLLLNLRTLRQLQQPPSVRD